MSRNVRLRYRRPLALAVDLLLLGLLLLLLSPRLTGLPVHEWLGICLAAPVVIHLLQSWRWIAASTRRVWRGAEWRPRVNYILNWILFLLIVVEVASGVAISAVALPMMGRETVNDRSWRAMHNLTLNWTLLAAGLHLALNWEPLLVALRRVSTPPAPPPGTGEGQVWPIVRGAGRAAAVLLAAAAVGMGLLLWLGPPNRVRLYAQDEIARFAPTPGHGVGQLLGETLLLGLVAYAGRRWLRVRL